MKYSTATVYDLGRPTTQLAQVAALRLQNSATAQIAELPGAEGFMLRVWAPGDLFEDGGGNKTAFFAIITFDSDGNPTIELDKY